MCEPQPRIKAPPDKAAHKTNCHANFRRCGEMSEVAVRLQITGYDCTLVDPPNIMEWECPICLLVLREPCLVSCCGRNFCRACIAVVQDKGEKCPICRFIAFTSMHNKGLERILQSLLVKCESERLGCAWSGELRTLDRHLEAVCLYADVRCKHAWLSDHRQANGHC